MNGMMPISPETTQMFLADLLIDNGNNCRRGRQSFIVRQRRTVSYVSLALMCGIAGALAKLQVGEEKFDEPEDYDHDTDEFR